MKNRCLALGVALVVVSLIGVVISFAYLPAINEQPVTEALGGEAANWFGQGGAAWLIGTAALLSALCWAKRAVAVQSWKRCEGPANCAILLYLLLVTSTLPFYWFLCEPSWHEPYVPRWLCWVMGPVGIWFIPTLFFLVDLSRLCRGDGVVSSERYLARSLVEIFLAFPVWYLFWFFCRGVVVRLGAL